jgi:hypothetical protein
MVMDTSWPDAFLEYEVRRYACETVAAPYVLIDGPLAPEVVSNRRRGRALLERLFGDERVFVGVVKSIMSSPFEYRLIARALRPGEAYVVETQRDYLLRSGGRIFYERWIDQQLVPLLRGVYKPGAKAFAFQCRMRDFEAALALLWCDRDELPGHEIPFLLNQVDQQLRSRFSLGDIEAVVEGLLAEHGEMTYFDEMHERAFR